MEIQEILWKIREEIPYAIKDGKVSFRRILNHCQKVDSLKEFACMDSFWQMVQSTLSQLEKEEQILFLYDEDEKEELFFHPNYLAYGWTYHKGIYDTLAFGEPGIESVILAMSELAYKLREYRSSEEIQKCIQQVESLKGTYPVVE